MPRRRIEGTVKFEVYFYRPKNVRKKYVSKPKHFVYRQWGTVTKRSEKGKPVWNKQFKSYGGLLLILNNEMRKIAMKDLREGGQWG